MSMLTEKPTSIEVMIINTAPADRIMKLYKDAGWWKNEYEKDLGFLKAVAQNSSFFAGAFHKGVLVGMGRALSDMVSDAYIQDVIVLKEFRGKGIGQKIVKLLVQELKTLGVDWIGLIGKPGTGCFYEKIGFKQLEGHIPFQYGE
jgi:GNAT superfamily N-acetyltransferase